MLQESRAFIITDYNGMKKMMEEKKQSKEIKKQIAKSIANLNPEQMKRIYKGK